MNIKVSSSSIVSPLHVSSIIVGDGDDDDDTNFDFDAEILQQVSFNPSFIIKYFLSVPIFARLEMVIRAFLSGGNC